MNSKAERLKMINANLTPEIRAERMRKVWATTRSNERIVWTLEMDNALRSLYTKYSTRYILTHGPKIIGVHEGAIRQRRRELGLSSRDRAVVKITTKFYTFATVSEAVAYATILNNKVRFNKAKIKPFEYRALSVSANKVLIAKYDCHQNFVGIVQKEKEI